MILRPKILLIGHNGQVGWELHHCLAAVGEVVAVDIPDIDLTCGDSIRYWVNESRPDVIINAAAYTAVDKAEREPDRALAINGAAPGVLAEAAKRLSAWLVHYSTDYVYDGAKNAPYVETDPPAPLCVYGRSKLAGDQAVQAIGGRHLIFRLCWVYGLRGSNFLLTIQRLAREREVLRVVSDQVGCPTWCRLIAKSTVWALRQALAGPDPELFTGLYHLSASSHTSWHGFAEAIVKAMPAETRTCSRVESITTAEYPTPARRPAWSVLSCDKLERVFGLRLPGWKEMLDLALT
ncbi:MAG: dTDP-4-dehydrorhamnose reductase [Verrucomicrobia bacterium]|jgi:dTDP-4-dehydrorhamnose reductase|nr:dTDP-4-dehydrorhamnose reductase [Verrucomicrobiota bacterium]OQC63740.1 MAG: dTDP-4-dehydrorhamnose reductase [Verrucomicrobia bacterium ADurb.Bin006]MDI9381798.1 dTDP-4-dehydrorhamnose reductase [Verrucomicrobiota bacterium]NMD21857.1 dTDP-4-dehydrorhamnose reductase [Verrucomicrobiota bacterium]HOA61646.1 dTDP-4-dehydrorhamnose reductase [Verrucomicrobiota bacterium]